MIRQAFTSNSADVTMMYAYEALQYITFSPSTCPHHIDISTSLCRSVPANASDAMYCMLLAQNAVHGAMAGFTSFTTGLVNNRMVYIPIKRIVATSPRVLDPRGR